LAPLALAQTQTFTYTYTGLPLPIYPDDWNVIAIGSIDVSRSIVISKVTVSVQVQYNGVGDLNLFFYSPIGTRTKLLERNCGSLQNINTTFDDFGASLGPTPSIRADVTQPLPTTLGQTSVTYDGTAAPMFFASNNFLSVQAPFTLSPGATTQIIVVNTAGSSTAVPLTVVAAKPGVLTYESAGRGQARAINQDGSLNGDGSQVATQKPVPAGNWIAVYATGLGAVNPALTAGTPAPINTLSTTVLPVTANIGGEDATVLWAGAAPTQIGVYQVNIVVPSDARSGANRLVLTSAGNSSQADVTIQVK
jgi:uncharacterized protein (TIGR03437 family)